jgi:hypothetical protein
MATGFFGQSRDVKPAKQFAAPEYAILTVAGDGGQLVQSVRGEFGRRIDSIPVVGDPNVYWGFGNNEGALTVGRYVGCKGFFNGWKGSKCGIIQTISIESGSGDECVCGAGGVIFTGLAIMSVGFTVTAGETTIQETIQMKAADMATG